MFHIHALLRKCVCKSGKFNLTWSENTVF